jgi:hypothetical protein
MELQPLKLLSKGFILIIGMKRRVLEEKGNNG